MSLAIAEDRPEDRHMWSVRAHVIEHYEARRVRDTTLKHPFREMRVDQRGHEVTKPLRISEDLKDVIIGGALGACAQLPSEGAV